MTWTCAAINHGVAVFSDGNIRPCCQISAEYSKPITELTNPDRFADLVTGQPPAECSICTNNEHANIPSYRSMFNSRVSTAPGLQFVDIRNTNLCNLKCRYCGPHFSSQWSDELGQLPAIRQQPLTHYKNTLITNALQWMYFTGGEPVLNSDHWQLLEDLIDSGRAANIALMYNTNLTTIKYKDKNILDIWKQFKQVTIQCSIDAVGKPLEYIRSGSSWEKIKSNLKQLQSVTAESNIDLTITPVLSILNIWFIDSLYEYARLKQITVRPIILTGPDYLALDVIPDTLKSLALEKVALISADLDPGIQAQITAMINNNVNNCLLQHTITHILLLDNLRGERLFDLLPFKPYAVDTILRNYEYQ